MMHKEKLSALRSKIDELDRELVAGLQKRLDISKQVAEVKAAGNMSITDTNRERQVIENALSVSGGENKTEVMAFMQSLIALSKLKQRELLMPSADTSFPESGEIPQSGIKVAYQGVHGAWGEQAAGKLFPGIELESFEYFEDVFESVKSRKIDFGVVPIENSQTGAIGEVYDLLRRYGCFIVGQVWLPVNQCLLAKPGTHINGIREVLSHAQGFGQCQRFLKNRFWTLTACRNTAVAAQEVSQKDNLQYAAIGSRSAAAVYGLDVLAADIDDRADNQTRFIAIAPQPIYNESSDTISVTFSTLNVSGALCSVLQGFMLSDINLTRIESRPVSADRYRFFADLQANILDPKTFDALKDVSVRCEYFEILGCYKSNGAVV